MRLAAPRRQTHAVQHKTIKSIYRSRLTGCYIALALRCIWNCNIPCGFCLKYYSAQPATQLLQRALFLLESMYAPTWGAIAHYVHITALFWEALEHTSASESWGYAPAISPLINVVDSHRHNYLNTRTIICATIGTNKKLTNTT